MRRSSPGLHLKKVEVRVATAQADLLRSTGEYIPISDSALTLWIALEDGYGPTVWTSGTG